MRDNSRELDNWFVSRIFNFEFNKKIGLTLRGKP